MREMPICAYIHRDGDEKDKELIDLMIALEAAPDDPACVIRIIEKRIQMNDQEIAGHFLEYARSLPGADVEKLQHIALNIAKL
jgi:hypothetical protein